MCKQNFCCDPDKDFNGFLFAVQIMVRITFSQNILYVEGKLNLAWISTLMFE